MKFGVFGRFGGNLLIRLVNGDGLDLFDQWVRIEWGCSRAEESGGLVWAGVSSMNGR